MAKRETLGRLQRLVTSTIIEHRMVEPGDRVLVALSGGPDSTALLAILADLRLEFACDLVAAHLDHGIRGPAAELDRQTAAATAARLDVPFHWARVELSSSSPNLEARARVARYEFLDHVARTTGCRRIATGHTEDDQAETVLMRLIRGAGVAGLGGIPPVRDGRIIRPLIRCSRAALLSYLANRGLAYRCDESNLDPRFVRNRVRHEILPLLESLNPACRKAIARSARSARAARQALEALFGELATAAITAEGHLRLDAMMELGADERAEMLRLWLARGLGGLEGIASSHIRAALALSDRCHPSGLIDLPGGWQIERIYDQLCLLAPHPEESWAEPVEVCREGDLSLPGWEFRARTSPPEEECELADLSPWTFHADADRLAGPLRLRPACPGDRLVPFGMTGGRKLQDIFVDRRVPRRQRWGRPVLEAEGQLVWVPGVVRAAHAPVTPATRRVFLVSARQLSVAGA